MWLDLIRSLLPADSPVDLPAAFEAFVKETGSADRDRFLAQLRDRGILSKPKYLDAQALLDIEVRDQLDAFADTRPSAAQPSVEDELDATQASVRAHSADAVEQTHTSPPEAALPHPKEAGPAPHSRFVTLSVIGEGGMGKVFLAKDQDLLRKVAYKQLHPQAAVDPRVVSRFLNEAQITAQLDHPNVVPIYALEVLPNGTMGYSMKLVRGKTLKEHMDEALEFHRRGEPLDDAHSLPTRLDHFLKVCDAMAFAHSKGIVHRDLKPANIMIGRYNEVYVMDWGIARLMGREDEMNLAEVVELWQHVQPGEEGMELTCVGQTLGTPRYMSPEQAAGDNKELDGRSDEYTLGIILMELVTLKRAVAGETTLGLLEKALHGEKEPIVHVDPKIRVDAELRAIIDKATRLKPDARYATVEALADDVRRYLRGEAVRALPDSAARKLTRWAGRHRQAALLVIGALIALSLLPAAWSEYRRKVDELAAAARERKVSAFLTLVSRQSHRIDSRFLELEEALEGLATAATWALTHGPESDEPVYFHEDYNTKGKEPPDLAHSELYRWDVSVDWPVAVRAPGLTREAILPTLRRLTPLRHHFREMFIASKTGLKYSLTKEQERRLLLEGGGAMDYGYLVLPQGVLYLYPGMGCTPPNYDPRIRPYYTLAAHKKGKYWGNPYVDSSDDPEGDDLVLPCATSMYGENGEFLGVAAVEVIFNKIIETLLMLPDVKAVKETSLLDVDGNVIVDSKDLKKLFRNYDLAKGLQLEPYGIPAVVEGVRKCRSGWTEIRRGGGARLVAYYRLEVLGWYYVVEAEPQELLEEDAGAGGEPAK